MSLRIKDWSKHYEMGDFKKTRHARWYPKSTRQDGKSYKKLMRIPGGHMHYLAFTLMEQIAAKAPVRGTLADDNGDLTADDMALITEAPADIFANAIKPLLEIGWLEGSEPVGISPENSESPGKFPPRRQGRQDKEDKTSSPAPKQPVASPEVQKSQTPWGLWVDLHKAKGLAQPPAFGQDTYASKQLAKAFPVLEELSKFMALYLADTDPFLVKNSHALRHMATRIGVYQNAARAPAEQPYKRLSECDEEFKKYLLDDTKP